MNQLGIIESCDGCGACCMEMGLPPGYAKLLSYLRGEEDIPGEAARSIAWHQANMPEELQRVENLPDELKRDIIKRFYSEPYYDGEPCLWLDMETRKCKHYELRPWVCRDLERGEDCLSWREQYAHVIRCDGGAEF